MRSLLSSRSRCEIAGIGSLRAEQTSETQRSPASSKISSRSRCGSPKARKIAAALSHASGSIGIDNPECPCPSQVGASSIGAALTIVGEVFLRAAIAFTLAELCNYSRLALAVKSDPVANSIREGGSPAESLARPVLSKGNARVNGQRPSFTFSVRPYLHTRCNRLRCALMPNAKLEQRCRPPCSLLFTA